MERQVGVGGDFKEGCVGGAGLAGTGPFLPLWQETLLCQLGSHTRPGPQGDLAGGGWGRLITAPRDTSQPNPWNLQQLLYL